LGCLRLEYHNARSSLANFRDVFHFHFRRSCRNRTEGGRKCLEPFVPWTAPSHSILKHSAAINLLIISAVSLFSCSLPSHSLATETHQHVWIGCSGHSEYLWSRPHRVGCQHSVRLSPVFPPLFAEFTNSNPQPLWCNINSGVSGLGGTHLPHSVNLLLKTPVVQVDLLLVTTAHFSHVASRN